MLELPFLLYIKLVHAGYAIPYFIYPNAVSPTDEVIAVGAIDENDNLASFSSHGPNQELVAPGVDIYSTYLNGGYIDMDGTSMACPHVAGVAALMLSLNPDLTNEEIRCILQETAEDQIGDPAEDIPGWDQHYGHGLVDAYEAVSAANFRYSIEVI